MTKCFFILAFFLGMTLSSYSYGTELGSGGTQATEEEVVETNPNIPVSDAEAAEANWRQENNCPPPPADAHPAALKCAKGVISSLGGMVTAPYHLFKASEACYNDRDYKKGLLAVVAPLLTGDGRVNHNFSTWPEGSQSLLQNSPLYQSYMKMSCAELMRMVSSRERRALETIHNKRLNQRAYQQRVDRIRAGDSRRLEQMKRMYPERDRILTPEEEAFERLYNTRKAMLEPGSNDRFLQRMGNKVLCLWKNTTVKSICEMGTDVAAVVLTGGMAAAGKATARGVARGASEQTAESIRDATLRRNGALNDTDRVAAARSRLGRGLTSAEQDAVLAAHNVGSTRSGSGFGNYTQAEINEKARILREAGFSASERRALMEDGITGRFADTPSPDSVVAESIGVASRNTDITKEMGLADVAKQMDRDTGVNPRDRSPHTGAYWQRNPDARRGVASSVREHIDSGGVITNRQQRDEMLRVLALETSESTRGGLRPDYDRLARYYERAGRPVDDSFVSYLTQGIPSGRTHSRFVLESQIAESRMAMHRLEQQMRYYADEMRARGLDMTPAEGRSRARQIKEQIDAIERNMQIRQRLLDSGQVSTDVY